MLFISSTGVSVVVDINRHPKQHALLEPNRTSDLGRDDQPVAR